MSKEVNGQKIRATGPSQVCDHVSAGRSNAPKRCLLNRECFHCAYDQWLDAIDLENVKHSLTTGTSKPTLAKVA